MKKIAISLVILTACVTACQNNTPKQVAQSENMGGCGCGVKCGCDDKNQEGHCGCGPNCCNR